jgi:hypothetical protein
MIQKKSKDTAAMTQLLAQSYDVMARAISSMLLVKHEAKIKDPSIDEAIKLMWKVKHPNLQARLAIERGDLAGALNILAKQREQQNQLMNRLSMLIF